MGDLIHLHFRVTFHDFLDAGERQRWVPVVRSFLFCCIDLTLPERTKEILERFAWLNVRFLVGRGHRGARDGSTALSDPITSFQRIYEIVYQSFTDFDRLPVFELTIQHIAELN